jgi:hypothetical protein
VEREFAILEGLIVEAAAGIEGAYFQMPVADADSIYRERVYCYELYHRLRSAWDGFPFSLGGEVDKARHPHFMGGPYARSKPDLLVHEPGNMDRNLACVEVKPCTASAAEIRDDLQKLTWFCRNARYHRGILLIYGMEPGETPEHGLLREKLRRATERNDGIDLARISVLAHAAVGQPAARVNL